MQALLVAHYGMLVENLLDNILVQTVWSGQAHVATWLAPTPARPPRLVWAHSSPGGLPVSQGFVAKKSLYLRKAAYYALACCLTGQAPTRPGRAAAAAVPLWPPPQDP